MEKKIQIEWNLFKMDSLGTRVQSIFMRKWFDHLSPSLSLSLFVSLSPSLSYTHNTHTNLDKERHLKYGISTEKYWNRRLFFKYQGLNKNYI